MAPGAFFFWAGFCRRKIVPGGRPIPAPGTSQKGGSGRVGRLGGPCGQGEARLAVHKSTGEGDFGSKKGGRSLLFMRGCFDIAALSRVLRKVALSRPASVATGDLRAPGRRSKLSIRRCRVLPVPTLSPRSFSLFLPFGIIEPRVGREDFSLSCWLRVTALLCESGGFAGPFPFLGLVLFSLWGVCVFLGVFLFFRSNDRPYKQKAQNKHCLRQHVYPSLASPVAFLPSPAMPEGVQERKGGCRPGFSLPLRPVAQWEDRGGRSGRGLVS